jgi:hypothetical protein
MRFLRSQLDCLYFHQLAYELERKLFLSMYIRGLNNKLTLERDFAFLAYCPDMPGPTGTLDREVIPLWVYGCAYGRETEDDPLAVRNWLPGMNVTMNGVYLSGHLSLDPERLVDLAIVPPDSQ